MEKEITGKKNSGKKEEEESRENEKTREDIPVGPTCLFVKITRRSQQNKKYDSIYVVGTENRPFIFRPTSSGADVLYLF